MSQAPDAPKPAQLISSSDDVEAVKALRAAYEKMTDQISRVIVGQSEVIEQVLLAIFCQGHALLVGVPGLAKTLLIRTLSQVLHLSFKRVQFTPDLMPSDITGTDVLEEDRTTGKRIFRFVHGPIFANMILADEINRTPPKTQAALLEAMEERQVSVGGTTYPLDRPFFVLATQNPIEQEGTYPLPAIQQDRFMFSIIIGYPTRDEEIRIVSQTTSRRRDKLDCVMHGRDLLAYQHVVREIPVADAVAQYAVRLVGLSRRMRSPSMTLRRSIGLRRMVRWTTSFMSARLRKGTLSLKMKRSSCASGSG